MKRDHKKDLLKTLDKALLVPQTFVGPPKESDVVAFWQARAVFAVFEAWLKKNAPEIAKKFDDTKVIE